MVDADGVPDTFARKIKTELGYEVVGIKLAQIYPLTLNVRDPAFCEYVKYEYRRDIRKQMIISALFFFFTIGLSVALIYWSYMPGGIIHTICISAGLLVLSLILPLLFARAYVCCRVFDEGALLIPRWESLPWITWISVSVSAVTQVVGGFFCFTIERSDDQTQIATGVEILLYVLMFIKFIGIFSWQYAYYEDLANSKLHGAHFLRYWQVRKLNEYFNAAFDSGRKHGTRLQKKQQMQLLLRMAAENNIYVDKPVFPVRFVPQNGKLGIQTNSPRISVSDSYGRLRTFSAPPESYRLATLYTPRHFNPAEPSPRQLLRHQQLAGGSGWSQIWPPPAPGKPEGKFSAALVADDAEICIVDARKSTVSFNSPVETPKIVQVICSVEHESPEVITSRQQAGPDKMTTTGPAEPMSPTTIAPPPQRVSKQSLEDLPMTAIPRPTAVSMPVFPTEEDRVVVSVNEDTQVEVKGTASVETEEYVTSDEL